MQLAAFRDPQVKSIEKFRMANYSVAFAGHSKVTTQISQDRRRFLGAVSGIYSLKLK